MKSAISNETASDMDNISSGTLFVVEKLCQFAADRSRGTIIVESTSERFPDAIEELKSVAARNLAITYAATQGMGDPRINGNVGHPYAVNAKGDSLEKVMEDNCNKPLPVKSPLLQPAAYRVDIPVARPIR